MPSLTERQRLDVAAVPVQRADFGTGGDVPHVRHLAVAGCEPSAIRREQQVSQIAATAAGIVETMEQFPGPAVAYDDAVGNAFAAVIGAENVRGRLPVR
jgi:hypothetical protein